jgi:hypothetical protein
VIKVYGQNAPFAAIRPELFADRQAQPSASKPAAKPAAALPAGAKPAKPAAAAQPAVAASVKLTQMVPEQRAQQVGKIYTIILYPIHWLVPLYYFSSPTNNNSNYIFHSRCTFH